MKISYLLAALWCSASQLLCQDLSLYPSPQASSLITYATVPVNYSTGVPNITLPLYTLPCKNHQLPISLSYHIDNNKVYDVPSWTGLGWSLNAGGVITRVIRGLPDEEAKGYNGTNSSGKYVKDLYNYINFQTNIPSYPEIPELRDKSSRDKFFIMSDAFGRGVFDSEPDLYYYNFLDYSGSFMINENKDIVNLSYNNLKIELYNGTRDAYRVTTVDGTQYTFGTSAASQEISYTSFNKAGAANSFSNQSVGFEQDLSMAKSYISACYLDRITYADGESVSLGYESYASDLSYSIPYHYLTTWTYAAGGSLLCTTVNNQTRCEEPKNIGYPVVLADHTTVGAAVKIGLLPNVIIYEGLTYVVYFSGIVHNTNAEVVSNPPFDVNMYKPTTGYQYPFGDDPYSVNKILLSKDQIAQFVPKKFNIIYAIQNPKKISVITSSLGSVKFVYENASRVDLFQKEGTLKQIEVYNKAGQKIKYIEPSYGYFLADNSGLPKSKRLKLSSIKEFSAVSNTFLPPTVITYNESVQLPVWGSCAVDPYGYYNGKESATLLNRWGHNPSYSMANLIKTITNPLGLRTTFVFESHGAGHRIKGITSEDIFTNKLVSTESYGYNNPSTGLSSLSSNYCQDGSQKSSNRFINNYSKVNGNTLISITALRYTIEYGKPDLFGARALHEYVTVDRGALGKTLMRFTNHESHPDATIKTGGLRTDAYTNLHNQFNSNRTYEYSTVFQSLNPVFGSQNCDNSFIDNSYQRGHLLEETAFDVNGAPIHKRQLTWTELSNNHNTGYGLKYLQSEDLEILNNSIPGVDNIGFALGFKQNKSASLFLQEEKVTDYELLSGSNTWAEHVKVHSFDYHTDHLLLKTFKAFDPQLNESRVTYNLYPVDYGTAFSGLLGAGIKDRIVEKVTVLERIQNIAATATTVAKPSGKYVLSGELNAYNPNGTVASSYVLTAQNPISSASFTFSNGSTLAGGNSNGTLTIGPAYLKTMDYAYRSVNGVLSYDTRKVQKPLSYPSTILWGYAGDMGMKYPIAKALNADGDGQVVAHTSFENPSEGGWTYASPIATDAKTGDKAVSGTIICAGIASPSSSMTQSYKLSFWAKGSGSISISPEGQTLVSQNVASANAWTYYEFTLSQPKLVINTGTVMVDELRLYPADAFMETSTYRDLVGKTSETDLQNKTTYYEYDEFNRLSTVRDQDRNILKKYTYSFRQ